MYKIYIDSCIKYKYRYRYLPINLFITGILPKPCTELIVIMTLYIIQVGMS